MRLTIRCMAMILGVLFSASAIAQENAPVQTVVYAAGQEGCHSFRIPAVVCTRAGTLLAFCEGRKESLSDAGDISLVLKRSLDNGATWSPLQTVVSMPGFTCSNPVPIVDGKTGAVCFVFTRHRAQDKEESILKGDVPPCTVWVTRSEDDGLTWAAPVEITASVSEPNWRWFATGPCHGIQLANGTLMVPCNHSLGPLHGDWHSHVICSEDGGHTWRRGGSAGGYTNESTLAELADGRLYLNMRNYGKKHCRAVAFSGDHGESWTPPRDDASLIEPVCQASCLRFSTEANGGKNQMLFSNPASSKRERLTVRLSYDECATWPVARELCPGPSAYSDLVLLPDRTIGCLYECGASEAYEQILFARFTLGWLAADKDSAKAR